MSVEVSIFEIAVTIILMLVYGILIVRGAKIGNYYAVLLGFLFLLNVNVNTYLVEYDALRSISRVVLAGFVVWITLRHMGPGDNYER